MEQLLYSVADVNLFTNLFKLQMSCSYMANISKDLQTIAKKRNMAEWGLISMHLQALVPNSFSNFFFWLVRSLK